MTPRTDEENTVRSCYIVCRRMFTADDSFGMYPMPFYDGGKHVKTGKNYKGTIWTTVTNKLLALQVDPVAYIHRSFTRYPPFKFPQPGNLVDSDMVQIWLDHATYGYGRCVSSYNSQQRILLSEVLPYQRELNWTMLDAIRYAVRDSNCKVSVLFKYLLALEYGLSEEFEDLFSPAAMQYMLDYVNYEAVLGARVPASMREEAARLRLVFCNYNSHTFS